MLKLFDKRPDNREYVTCEDYPTLDKIGVEVELENFGARPDAGFQYWHIVHDGSLRNDGAELVMLHPTCGKGLKGAFEELSQFLKDNPQLDPSDRTSVHCHIDVRDMDVHQVYKMMLAYLVFEGSLYHMGGPSRAESNFCPPIGICDQALQIIGQMDSHGERYEQHRLEQHIQQFGKYCGVNFNAMGNFGSLEFRMHEGTTDAVRIETWCNTLMCLKQIGREDTFIPVQLPEIMSNDGPVDLCEKIFGPYAAKLMEDPNFDDNCYEGVRNAEYCIHQQQLTNYTREVRTGRGRGASPQAYKMGGVPVGDEPQEWVVLDGVNNPDRENMAQRHAAELANLITRQNQQKARAIQQGRGLAWRQAQTTTFRRERADIALRHQEQFEQRNVRPAVENAERFAEFRANVRGAAPAVPEAPRRGGNRNRGGE